MGDVHMDELDLDDLEPDDAARVRATTNPSNAQGVRVLNPRKLQKLGFWAIICTVLNRSIGTGIFVTPAVLLKATGSPGAALLLWMVGVITIICALLIWLQFALSIPKYELRDLDQYGNPLESISLQCVPRSGGEKNYLEYVYGSDDKTKRFQKVRTTCIYGFLYITLGNLSGNAIYFGVYVLEAAGITHGHDSLARGLGVLCMTAACLLHGTYRQGGVYTIIVLAIFKVCILIVIIVIGFAAMGGRTFGYGSVQGQTITDSVAQTGPGNLNADTSFKFAKHDFASYANSTLFVVYTFSGNEQPFYVLSEVERPKKIFAKAMVTAVTIIVTLFTLVHVAFLGVVSHDPSLSIQCLSIKDSVNKYDTDYIRAVSADPHLIGESCKLDMATVFFSAVFGGDTARRVMSGVIAASVFGNVAVMTFTASRVKQEIAKEGVVPLFFARSIRTPWALIRRRLFPNSNYEAERSPSPGLFLYWFFSMILIGATSARTAEVAYQILVSLYSYVIVILIGFFTSLGLLYARWRCEDGQWVQRAGCNWGGPYPAIIYLCVCIFCIIAPFVKPTEGSPFQREVTWYAIPTIGLGFLLAGYVYYLGLWYGVSRFFQKRKKLMVTREAVIVKEQGEYVQLMEDVYATWEVVREPKQNGYHI